MIEYLIYNCSDNNSTEKLLAIRLETLREVFELSDDHRFDEAIINATRDYFINGDHTTAVAVCGEKIISCASCCYVRYIPTLPHSTGVRGHIMGVYTVPEYRRQGIAKRLMQMIIDEARNRGVTELSLDATSDGAALYEQLGFKSNHESMNLIL